MSKPSLLERVVKAHKARSMHHVIALDALGLMTGEAAPGWKAALLYHHHELLDGAKAPDAKFKDFKNHVLHVSEGEWGGARDAAAEWYAKSVAALKGGKWSKAAFNLGVLSHYVADPCQPFHTGQTEEEGTIHRAVEWSISKSKQRIAERIAQTGYPSVSLSDGPGFVSDLVLAGAKRAHPHYQTFIDHYDLHAGMDNPPTGVDETMFEAVCDLVAFATSAVAAVYTRATEEAGVAAPRKSLSLQGYIAALDVPVRVVANRLADAADRHALDVMYCELQRTGKVVRTLPADDRVIRRLHARDVLRVPLKELNARPIGETGTKHVPWPAPEPEAELARVKGEIEPKEAASEGPSAANRKREEAAFLKAERAARRDELKQAKLAAKAARKATADAKRASKASDKAQMKQEGAPVPAEAAPAQTPEPVVVKVPEPKREPDPVEPQDKSEPAQKPVVKAANSATAPDETAERGPEPPAVKAETPKSKPEPASAQAPVEAQDDAGASEPRSGRLTRGSPVVDAPSIGRKTARRLGKAGISTVADLLDCDPDETAELLNARHIDRDVLIDWQDQARLMMDVPGLRVHDAQILVGAGIRSSEDLAAANAEDVFLSAIGFLSSPEGERVSHDDTLDEAEVEQWIGLARGEAA